METVTICDNHLKTPDSPPEPGFMCSQPLRYSFKWVTNYNHVAWLNGLNLVSDSCTSHICRFSQWHHWLILHWYLGIYGEKVLKKECQLQTLNEPCLENLVLYDVQLTKSLLNNSWYVKVMSLSLWTTKSPVCHVGCWPLLGKGDSISLGVQLSGQYFDIGIDTFSDIGNLCCYTYVSYFFSCCGH